MTKPYGEKEGGPTAGLLTPIITILLSSFLFVGIGFAGIASSTEASGYVSTSSIVIKLRDDNDIPLSSGDFSTETVIKYTLLNGKYNIFAGSYKLGSSTLVIDATKSNAESISLSFDVTHKKYDSNIYEEGLPYTLDPRFVIKNHEGMIITDLSNVGIEPGVLNIFQIEFYGDMNTTHKIDVEPRNFKYGLDIRANIL